MDLLGSGVQGQPAQHGEILSIQEIQKLSSMVVSTCGPSYLEGAELGGLFESKRLRVQ